MEPPPVLLLGCVKRKRPDTHPARDLYYSPLWNARRAYAERSGLRWFILSALHGLVDPYEPLAPYDSRLSDRPAFERRAWGDAVAAELQRKIGDLAGMTFEVHAGAAYRLALEPALAVRGARISSPTSAISGVGAQIAWYSNANAPAPTRRRRATAAEVDAALQALDGAPTIVAASSWPPRSRRSTSQASTHGGWTPRAPRRLRADSACRSRRAASTLARPGRRSGPRGRRARARCACGFEAITSAAGSAAHPRRTPSTGRG